LAYFSFVFADTASVDLELEIYPLVQGELGQRWGCELVNWQTGKLAKWQSGWEKEAGAVEATTLFDEDLRSCFDLCQQRPPTTTSHSIPYTCSFMAPSQSFGWSWRQ